MPDATLQMLDHGEVHGTQDKRRVFITGREVVQ